MSWHDIVLTFYLLLLLFLSKKFYLHKHHQICRDRLLLPRHRLATRMGTKVKGLLKGLRYISQIFDEKEDEMEIGFPTDVKHVSHIGWDGPSANAPSWMNEFKPSEDGSTHSAPEDMKNMSSNPASEGNSVTEKRKPRSRRPSKGEESPFSSPARSVGDVPLKHRRRRSTNTPADSPRDESGSIRTRRSRNSTKSAESPNVDDQPAIPKHSRTRKSKGSGGSTKSKVKEGSTSTNANNSTTEPASEGSCSGSVQDKKNTANHLSSVLEAYEER